MNKSVSMAADSTQEISYNIYSKKRKKKSDHKKVKKSRSHSTNNLSDSDSDLLLSKEILPIEGYLNNKQEMVHQMFKAVSNKKLTSLLPQILRSIDIEELKKLCVDQLDIMSEKRIKSILQGIDPSSISSSDTDVDMGLNTSEEEEDNKDDIITETPQSLNPVETSSNKSSNVDKEYIKEENNSLPNVPKNEGESVSRYSGSEDGEIVEIEKIKDLSNSSPSNLDVIEPDRTLNSQNNKLESNTLEVHHTKSSNCSIDFENKTNLDIPLISCSKMEILELEMRARAIKSMLNRAKSNKLKK